MEEKNNKLMRKKTKPKNKFYWSFEKKVYILGLILIPFGIFGIIIFDDLFNWMAKINFSCVMYDLTGLYCPGCGGTRSINYLLNGHFLTSFIYHPFVITALLMYIIFMISHTISLFKKDYNGIEIKVWHTNFLLILVIANFLIKNILMYCGIIILK